MGNVVALEKFGPVTEIPVAGVSIKFDTPNELTRFRADTLLTKEPETIEWIDSFAPGDLFCDVGANVGCYTLYAAKVRGLQVIAFEPESQNYALLHRNIYLNGVSDNVRAYCLGLSDRVRYDVINLAKFVSGGSLHTIDSVDYRGKSMAGKMRQGCAQVPLDDVIGFSDLHPPKHLKVDVDGVEDKVIAGAELLLPYLQSLCIEIDPDQNPATIERIESARLELVREGARSAKHNIRNMIFRRPDHDKPDSILDA